MLLIRTVSTDVWLETSEQNMACLYLYRFINQIRREKLNVRKSPLWVGNMFISDGLKTSVL